MEYEKQIKRAKERLEDNENIIEENKQAILDFDRHLRLNDYSEARRKKYLSKIPKLAEIIEVPFSEAQRRDIEDIVLHLNERDDIKPVTRGDYKILLKRFMRFIGDGEYPDCVKWIKTTNKVDSDKVPEELLTEDDISGLLDNTKNLRDKALISTMWETGARVGELMNLTIGSIEDRQHGLKIVVDGKTGKRRVPLIESVPHIREWLKVHPKDSKKAPLWVNIGTVNTGEAMSYASINKMLREVRNRSDVDKPVNPHHFRHSRATYLANKFTEAQLCEFFGWVQGSDVPAQYVHLSGRDIDNAYDSLYGIQPDDEPDKSKLTPKNCPRCDEQVDPKAQFCYRCGQALSVEGFKELERGEVETETKFTKLLESLEDDEIRKTIKALSEKVEKQKKE